MFIIFFNICFDYYNFFLCVYIIIFVKLMFLKHIPTLVKNNRQEKTVRFMPTLI